MARPRSATGRRHLRSLRAELGRLLPGLARWRGQDLGSFVVGEVELVRTDRFLSPAGTTVLARLPLTGRPGPG